MRALVIGCGSIGARHAANLAAAGADVLAYDTREEASLAAAGAAEGISACSVDSPDWEWGPDAVVVATPTSTHLPHAIEALDRGCHLFLEKPVSCYMSGVDHLVARAGASGLVAVVGYNFRFDPAVARVRETVLSRALGRALSARAAFGTYLPTRRGLDDYRADYGGISAMGGGVLLDALTHQIDYLSWMFGAPERVFCDAGHRSGLDIDVEDVADITIGFDGLTATVHGAFFERPHRHDLLVCCERGTIAADLVQGIVDIADAESGSTEHWVRPFPLQRCYEDEAAHFVRLVEAALEAGTPPADLGPAAGVADGAANLAVLVAAACSASEGRVVRL